MTTFSRRPTAKTTTSAMSSGVRGSHPLVSLLVNETPKLRIVHIRINCICLFFVTIKPHQRELSFHLAGVYLNNANPGTDQFLSKTLTESLNGSLGRTIYRTSW